MVEPIIFEAKNYLNRQDLESDIKSRGEIVCVVQGTRQELKQLQLSDQCRVFNCSVEAIDISTTKILADKIKK